MFSDKTVIVTGASSGIGAAIAKRFKNLGANVVVNYRKNEAGAMEVLKSAGGGEAIAVQADIAKFDEAKQLVDQAIEAFGRVDILINNAGITADNLMLRMDEGAFDRVIATNLKGAWNMTRHMTQPFFKQRYGRIINISSVVASIGNAGQANYVAAKAGLEGMSKSLAKEFGKRNITVNAVAPGFIETAMTSALPDDIKKTYLATIPLNRFGSVDDVSDIVCFLASDQASYITGQIIHVNGGMVG